MSAYGHSPPPPPHQQQQPAPASSPYGAPYGGGQQQYAQQPYGHAAAPPQPVLTAFGCTYTRQELQQLLKESNYGQNQGAYSAYFQQGSGGGHVCRSCGLGIGAHTSAAASDVQVMSAQPVAGTVAAAPFGTTTDPDLANLPPPDVRIHDTGSMEAGPATVAGGVVPAAAVSKSCPFPRHWKGGAWFINFLEFDGFAGKHVEMVGSRKHRRLQTSAQMRWRCVAPNSDHSGPCGETFVTKGVILNPQTLRPDKGAVANMTIVHKAEDAMMKHFEFDHRLEALPPGKWSTTLIGDYCEHPMAALSCCLFPMSCMPMCPDTHGRGFCNAVTASGPAGVPNQATVAAIGHDEWQCSCPCVCSCGFSIFFLPHLIVGMTFLGLGSVLTLCGIPCGEDFPLLLCCCCYARRRRFVNALDIDETHVYSRLATFFCCPCSEVQQYRELRNSGVWAGLCCCTASDEDKAAMTPSAVRERYSVDGAYGVQAKSGAGHVAKRTASLIDTLPGPKIGWSME